MSCSTTGKLRSTPTCAEVARHLAADPDDLPSLAGSTVVVTGCNTGIGKQTAGFLASLGATVVMGCRSVARAEAAAADERAKYGAGTPLVMHALPLDLGDVPLVVRRVLRQHVVP